MFPLGSDGKPEVVSTIGKRFCAYRQRSLAAGPLPKPCLGDDVLCGSIEVQNDVVAVFKQGTPEALNQAASALKEQFKAQLRVPASLPSGTIRQIIFRPRFDGLEARGLTDIFQPITDMVLPAQVKVFVLDDVGPGKGGQLAGGDHGFAVRRLIQESACPGTSPCALELISRNVFTNKSGVAGSTIELAQAVAKAARDANGAPSIINLSLGIHELAAWSSLPTNNEFGQLKIAIEALQAAINYATAKGTLVIAAIGNRDGGPTEATSPTSGGNAMYPGKWATDGWTIHTSQPHFDGARMLVFGAGAVRANGADAPSTRPNGQAALVAPGYASTIDSQGNGKLFWEGSSFSTAALTAVSAATWAYMPRANLMKVMETVSAKAAPLGRTTSTCGNGSSCDIRHVQLCESVRAALEYSYGTRTSKPMLDSLVCNMPRRTTSWPVINELAPQDPFLDFAPHWSPVAAVPFHHDCAAPPRIAAVFPRNTDSCPFGYIDNGQPDGGTHREPGDTPCPSCRLQLVDGSIRMIGKLDPSWALLVSSPSLKLKAGALTPPGPVGLVQKAGPTTFTYVYELGDALAHDANGQEIAVPLDMPLNADLANLEAVLEFKVVDQAHNQTTAMSASVPFINLSSSP
jgi:hypothetical protein